MSLLHPFTSSAKSSAKHIKEFTKFFDILDDDYQAGILDLLHKNHALLDVLIENYFKKMQAVKALDTSQLQKILQEERLFLDEMQEESV